MTIGLEGRLLAFAVSLLVGGMALHVGTHVVSDTREYAHTVLTALLGALVWALLEPVPLLDGLLAIVAWVAVIKWRYRLGWIRLQRGRYRRLGGSRRRPRGPRVGRYRLGFGTRYPGA